METATPTSLSAAIVKGQTVQTEVRILFDEPTTTAFADGGHDVWQDTVASASMNPEILIPIVNGWKARAKGQRKN